MNNEIVKIGQEKEQMMIAVNQLSIVDQETYHLGASMKISLSTFRKKIDLFFSPMVNKAKSAYDEVRETRDKYLKPTKELEDIVKNKLKVYEREMERKEAEERKKAEEEAQKKIAEENKKREEEAEQRRKDEAEVMGVDVNEVKKVEAEKATADDIEVEQPLASIDRVKGLGIRKIWRWKVVDIKKVPKEYFILDEMLINKEVRGLKEKFNVSGLQAYED